MNLNIGIPLANNGYYIIERNDIVLPVSQIMIQFRAHAARKMAAEIFVLNQINRVGEVVLLKSLVGIGTA